MQQSTMIYIQIPVIQKVKLTILDCDVADDIARLMNWFDNDSDSGSEFEGFLPDFTSNLEFQRQKSPFDSSLKKLVSMFFS